MSVIPKSRFAFRLHTVFAVIFMIVLLLPLSGMYFFRIYESELVRQTEMELIAQGVFISSMYKHQFQQLTPPPKDYGIPVVAPEIQTDQRYHPYPPQLDLRTADFYPPRPDAVKPSAPPDPVAVALGKKVLPILREAKISTLASMRVLDAKGTVVAGTAENGLSLASVDEIATALTGRYASVLRQRISDEPRPTLKSLSRGTVIRVFVAIPIIVKDRVIGVVYLSRSPRNVLKALYEEKESVISAGFFVLIIGALITIFLSFMIGRPLIALRANAQRLALGDWTPKALPPTRIEEIASLNDSFERMSATLQSRSEYIRSFAMHLAHEFKTPLTAIQGAIELMHDHANDMAPEQRERFMDNITKDTDRMKALVTRLLELARADMLQAGRETADIAQVAQDLQRKYAQKITVDYADKHAVAAIAGDILETALSNLIDNSLQHGAKHIRLAVSLHQEALELDIIDDGEGITEGNIAKVFTPFFTTKREKGGTGLGLVITRSLLKAHGGDIENIPAKSGAHFRIILRTAPVTA